MPINWELGLAPKIAGNWDFFPKICWDLGISQKLTGIVKKLLNWELGFVLKFNWELGLGTPHQDPHSELQRNSSAVSCTLQCISSTMQKHCKYTVMH